MVSNTPGTLRLRGPSWASGPVEPQQRHRSTHARDHGTVKKVGPENSLFASQVPTASVYVEGGAALNRVRWSHSGKEIATGDSEGHVQVYDVGEVR